MATKAGTAYVEVKYDPDSIRRLRADTLAEGKKISKSWEGADKGLINFDRAAAKVNKTMSGGPFGLFDALGNVGYAFLKMEGFAQKAGDSFGNLLKPLTTGEAGLTSFGSALGSITPLFGLAAAGAAALGAALLVLPALAAAATFVLTALLDAMTILAAVVVSLAGPLLVVTGLLGGLGAAFAFVAAQSLKSSATQQQVHDNLLKLHVAQQTYNADLAKYGKNATQTENALIALHKAQDAYESSLFGVQLNIGKLKEQFSTLITTLGKDFRPELLKLADAASQALTYLNRIAKLPLKQAFESLGTEGVAMLNKFVYGVANVLKRPFRLAIQVAFGAGGANANAAIANWWNSLTGYLFGYSQRHPIKLGDHVIGFSTKQVKGALDPILKFLGDQQFVKTGMRWAHEIIDGLVRLWEKNAGLRAAVHKIFDDAGHQAARAFRAAFGAEIHSIPWKSLGIYILHQLDMSRALENLARRAFAVIKGYASSALGSIAGTISSKLGAAWDRVRSAATGIWNSIVGYIEGHIPHPHIDFGGILKAGEHIWDTIVSYIENHIPTPTIHLSIPTPSIGGALRGLLPHTGGLVLPGGGLALAGGGVATGGIPGRDSVPALLTPGELVLNKQQQLALLHGGAGAPITVNVALSQEAIAGIARVEVIQGGKRTARTVKAGRKW